MAEFQLQEKLKITDMLSLEAYHNDVILYNIRWSNLFLVTLIAFKHDKKDINEIGIINTVFMILSIGFPYLLCIFNNCSNL